MNKLFNTIKTDGTNFSIGTIGTKAFDSLKNIGTNFTIIVSDFTSTYSGIMRLRLKIDIVVKEAKLYITNNISINVGNTVITILDGRIKIVNKNTINFIESINVNFIPKSINKNSITFYTPNILFNILSKIIIKIFGINIDNKLNIIINPIFKSYYMLNHWDGYIVSSLDSMLLKDMDYVII